MIGVGPAAARTLMVGVHPAVRTGRTHPGPGPVLIRLQSIMARVKGTGIERMRGMSRGGWGEVTTVTVG